MNKKLGKISLALATVVLTAGSLSAADNMAPRVQAGLAEEIRHELVMLPWFSVFDTLHFQVTPEGAVTLQGAVTRPTLKSSAENVVKHIEGVTSVDNKIEVLPLSPFDDRIRLAVAQSIYNYGPLQRYSLGSQLPIRIIVRNGNVTLEGVVANEFDRNVANVRANAVSGVFSVTNHLQVENAAS